MTKSQKLLTILIIMTVGLWALNSSQIGKKDFPLSFVSAANISGTNYTNTQPTLKNIVNIAMSGVPGQYAIVIKNIKTGETYNLNEHQAFQTGSLYKLWVMGTVYDQIATGSLTSDQVLSQDIPTLNQEFEIDPDYAELTEGTITASVDQALYQMITISSNYNALLLTEKVKESTISQFMQKQGLSESHLGEPPMSTASDIAKFLGQIYNSQVVSPEASKEMMDLLAKQQLNDGLPKLLPEDVQVAHKTGDIDYDKHDAGVVLSPKGDYIIVVLSETDSPADAQAQIAKLSQAVYQYFTR